MRHGRFVARLTGHRATLWRCGRCVRSVCDLCRSVLPQGSVPRRSLLAAVRSDHCFAAGLPIHTLRRAQYIDIDKPYGDVNRRPYRPARLRRHGDEPTGADHESKPGSIDGPGGCDNRGGLRRRGRREHQLGADRSRPGSCACSRASPCTDTDTDTSPDTSASPGPSPRACTLTCSCTHTCTCTCTCTAGKPDRGEP